MSKTSLVIVSHSAQLAAGVAEVAQQMAPEVAIYTAGGTDEDGIGTSFDKIDTAVNKALENGEVVILSDLGSATMTVENVLEFLDDERAQWVDGPLVEGAVLAAVSAQQGGDLKQVIHAVKEAATQWQNSKTNTESDSTPPSETKEETNADAKTATVTLSDPDGLHARPAAMVARAASGKDAVVTINGADARSVLALMALGLKHADTVTIAATGPQATEAVEAIVKELS